MVLSVILLMSRFVFIKILLTSALFFLAYYYIAEYIENVEIQYVRRVVDAAKSKWRPECGENRFSLYGMDYCSPMLSCDDIHNEVKKGRYLNHGTLKKTYISPFAYPSNYQEAYRKMMREKRNQGTVHLTFEEETLVFLANWKGYTVVWNELQNSNGRSVFLQGAQTLKELHSSKNRVTQLLGTCDTITITEFHQLGKSKYIDGILQAVFGKSRQDSVKVRMQLCIDYVEILDYLQYRNRNKTYVMCDSYSLELTLEQYLLTDNLRLILNDVDYMAVIDNVARKGIICGNGFQLEGELMAPEQLGPKISEIPLHDEKIEIWKIPNICNYFLGSENDLKWQLSDIHSKCKHVDPKRRPSIKEVLKVYKNVIFD